MSAENVRARVNIFFRKFLKYTGLVPLALVSVSCSSVEYDEDAPFVRAHSQTQEEIEFAKRTLDSAQSLSFSKNREYCGYIGVTASGEYVATKPSKGLKSSCVAKDALDDDVEMLASYHTHGSYSEDSDSEVPSEEDLLADQDEGIDGYISTPGGRVWYNDSEQEESRLLCGEGCVRADLHYDPTDTPHIASRYTVEALQDREN